MPVFGAEKIRVGSAAGRVLAEDVVASVSLPPMPVSAMGSRSISAFSG
jgi:molybdopterin biosynthesis enzyme